MSSWQDVRRCHATPAATLRLRDVGAEARYDGFTLLMIARRKRSSARRGLRLRRYYTRHADELLSPVHRLRLTPW